MPGLRCPCRALMRKPNSPSGDGAREGGKRRPHLKLPATLRPVSAVRPPGRTRSRSVPKCAGAARRCGAGVAESDSRGPATGGTVLPLWLAAVNDPTQGSRTDSDRLVHVSRHGCRLNTGPGAGDGITAFAAAFAADAEGTPTRGAGRRTASKCDCDRSLFAPHGQQKRPSRCPGHPTAVEERRCPGRLSRGSASHGQRGAAE